MLFVLNRKWRKSFIKRSAPSHLSKVVAYLKYLLQSGFFSAERCYEKSGYLSTVKSRLYVQVGTKKFGRRTERDVQVKIILRITPCKVFWIRLYRLDVQTSGTYN